MKPLGMRPMRINATTKSLWDDAECPDLFHSKPRERRTVRAEIMAELYPIEDTFSERQWDVIHNAYEDPWDDLSVKEYWEWIDRYRAPKMVVE